jgi:hypothetical protein
VITNNYDRSLLKKKLKFRIALADKNLGDIHQGENDAYQKDKKPFQSSLATNVRSLESMAY